MSAEVTKFRHSVLITLSFAAVLWGVKALEWAFAYDLSFLGIHPRTLNGALGIITAPLVHGDLLHLTSNTFPLIILGVGLFYFYDKIALEVILWIYFATGFWVWIAARDAYHIGASGLIYGVVSFLFFSGLFRKDIRSIAVSAAVLFLYRSMVYGIFPGDESISWESHLLGAIAGLFCAFYFRKTEMLPRKLYDFEKEELQTEQDHPYHTSMLLNYKYVDPTDDAGDSDNSSSYEYSLTIKSEQEDKPSEN